MLIEEIKDRNDLQNITIAQDDDNDYEESGYIAVYDGKRCALARYSHCSCYGTWTALNGGDYSKTGNGITWDWFGSKRQLLKMAREKLDPHAPFGTRKADEKDYDYDHLMNVYQQILEWHEKTKRGKKS
jgi:hypothetical protein